MWELFNGRLNKSINFHVADLLRTDLKGFRVTVLGMSGGIMIIVMRYKIIGSKQV